MNTVVMGIIPAKEHASMLVDELRSSGYESKEISFITREKDHDMSSSSTATAAAAGATTGGVVGGLAGLLLGIGAITVPGLGALLIGGPIAAALGLTGAAATTAAGAMTGAAAGGVLGALLKLGVNETDAKLYEGEIKKGGVLIAVPTTHRGEKEVSSMLEAHGGHSIKTVEW